MRGLQYTKELSVLRSSFVENILVSPPTFWVIKWFDRLQRIFNVLYIMKPVTILIFLQVPLFQLSAIPDACIHLFPGVHYVQLGNYFSWSLFLLIPLGTCSSDACTSICTTEHRSLVAHWIIICFDELSRFLKMGARRYGPDYQARAY